MNHCLPKDKTQADFVTSLSFSVPGRTLEDKERLIYMTSLSFGMQQMRQNSL